MPLSVSQPGGLGEGGVRRDADPDHEQVGLDRRAVCQCHDRQPPLASMDATSVLDAQVDAVRAVEGGEDAGDLRAQDAEQGQVEGLQDGDVGARAGGPPRRPPGRSIRRR